MTKKEKGLSIAEQKAFDKDTQIMMYEGASLSQLKQIFSMDIQKIKAKLHGLAPVKMRAGHPIYSIAEAARYLVEPMWPIEEYIKHMNHADLPMLLRKEYWAGMRSRQLFEQAAGDLWPTDEVLEHISEILKTIAFQLKLASDTVERETGLTPQQRKIVQRIIDDALNKSHRTLQEMLEKRKGEISGRSATATTIDDDEL